MISDLVKIISLLNRMDSFHRLHIDVQAEESEFQACANLVKIKKHFQFILTNYSITSPEMVSNNKPPLLATAGHLLVMLVLGWGLS